MKRGCAPMRRPMNWCGRSIGSRVCRAWNFSGAASRTNNDQPMNSVANNPARISMKTRKISFWLASLGATAGCVAGVLAQDQFNPPDRGFDRPPQFGDGPPQFGGPGGPGRGGFGGVQERQQLVKQFDKDGNKRLDATERKAAFEYLQKEQAAGRGRRGPGGRGGFGGRGGEEPPGGPGPKPPRAAREI